MKTFLICPVRGKEMKSTEGVVKILENSGWEVHWPPRDTNQNDPIGFNICNENLEAIKDAEVIHVIWDGKSQGCLFDLGMSFALDKKIIVIEVPEYKKGEKSFQAMVHFWEMTDERRKEIMDHFNNYKNYDFPL